VDPSVARHCTFCGARLGSRPDPDGGRRCPSCSRRTYANPKPAVEVALLGPDGQILMVRRAVDPHRGLLDLPGGFVEVGETVDDALRREVTEETGLAGRDLSDLAFTGSVVSPYEFEGVVHDVLVLQHVGRYRGTPVAGDDAAEITRALPEHLAREDMAFPDLHLALMAIALADEGRGSRSPARSSLLHGHA